MGPNGPVIVIQLGFGFLGLVKTIVTACEQICQSGFLLAAVAIRPNFYFR